MTWTAATNCKQQSQQSGMKIYNRHEQLEQSEMESFKRVTGTVTVKTELKEQLWQS